MGWAGGAFISLTMGDGEKWGRQGVFTVPAWAGQETLKIRCLHFIGATLGEFAHYWCIKKVKVRIFSYGTMAYGLCGFGTDFAHWFRTDLFECHRIPGICLGDFALWQPLKTS